MKGLSERQRQTLDFVRDYVRKHGIAPSRPEIAQALGLTHKSMVDYHLLSLANKGWIELRPGNPRNIRLLNDDLPLAVAGPIAAGEPILAEGRVTARIPRTVAEMFSPRPDYFVKVEGDSMNKLGTGAGTIVAVEARPAARDGEVVVARVDDEVTLKRFVRTGERTVELRPESTNTKHRPTRVDLATTDFHVDGVAVGALIGEGFGRIGDEAWAA